MVRTDITLVHRPDGFVGSDFNPEKTMIGIWTRVACFVVGAVVVAIGGTALQTGVTGVVPPIRPQ